MQTKKTTMLGAVLAVAIIAFAGVGYAATGYTATTTNGGNHMQSVYLQASQTSSESAAYADGSFLKDLTFDSVNTAADTYTYTPRYTGVYNPTAQTYTPGDTSSVAEGSFKAACISKDLTLNATPVNDTTVTVKLEINVDDTFNYNSGLKYVFLLTKTNDANFSKAAEYIPGEDPTTHAATLGKWTFNDLVLDGATSYKVTLIVALTGTSLASTDVGFATAAVNNATITTPTSFTFVLTVTSDEIPTPNP